MVDWQNIQISQENVILPASSSDPIDMQPEVSNSSLMS